MKELIEFSKEYSEFEDSTLGLIEEDEKAARLAFSIKIQNMIAKYPDCADLHHKLGLCHYSLSHWEDEHKNIIELAFHRALILDSGSVFSIMFLVFFYFDIGKYHLSLCFNRMLTKLDISNIPRWRHSKLAGLEVACLIYMGTISASDLEIKVGKFLHNYEDLDDDDRDVAEPCELIRAIEMSKFMINKSIFVKNEGLKRLSL